ncbi:hypothetical protein PanWU01x14_223680, partial [Parasponia andersonii]
ELEVVLESFPLSKFVKRPNLRSYTKSLVLWHYSFGAAVLELMPKIPLHSSALVSPIFSFLRFCPFSSHFVSIRSFSSKTLTEMKLTLKHKNFKGKKKNQSEDRGIYQIIYEICTYQVNQHSDFACQTKTKTKQTDSTLPSSLSSLGTIKV